ncbi:hypothetical protein [Glutamicibacter halophytocola]|uniref:hypothetical protein n=1 Tax=Glutamicibacter halophytocola TaxID=1933880 RepID=UPI0015C53772|nr:hypothetical protein [Glutamicibacter halophytocola]NQD42442.1 hypothetical protein [Glutamicibacter halophytocola]
MNIFKRGDRVAFAFDKSTTGIVTRANKSETRVLWDSGHETPVDPAELIHSRKPKKNDRSGDFGEPATANETNTQKERDFMSKTTENERNAFIASTLRDKFARHGIKANMSTEALGAFSDENSADPIDVAQAHMFAFGYGAHAPELEEPEHSEDELHAALLHRGASEKTTVAQLALWAIELDVSGVAMFSAYESLGFTAKRGASNA